MECLDLTLRKIKSHFMSKVDFSNPYLYPRMKPASGLDGTLPVAPFSYLFL